MANYKVVDTDQLDYDMKSVADAIRAKGGTSSSLSFPDGYIAAVQNIEEGADLPLLVNPGTAFDLLKDKELIDQSGAIVTGTIETKTANSVVVNGSTVTTAPGYYKEQVVKSVATVEQAEPEISVDSAGLITASATQGAGYVAAGSKSSTKQLSTQAAQTITPGTSNKTISSGKYLTGTQTIKGDANLKAENIANGVTIFGIEGTHIGGITPSGTKSITANGTYDVTEYASADVAIPTVAQATPTISVSSAGKITATSTQGAGLVAAGTKTATEDLTVQAAKTITPSASTQTAVASGRYTTGAVTVAGDSNLKAANIKNGTKIFGVTGTYAPPPSSVESVFPTISISSTGKIESTTTLEAAYYNGGVYSNTKQMDVQGATTWIPKTSSQIIPGDTYLLGDQIIKGDPNLIASNIKNGVNIFNVAGTLRGLPSIVSNMTSGTFTPSADVSGSCYITHGLGSNADFFMLWPTSIPIIGYYGYYVRLACGFTDPTVFSSVSSSEASYLINWYYDTINHASPGTWWYNGSLDCSQTFPVLITGEKFSTALKGGTTYRWIAGTLT